MLLSPLEKRHGPSFEESWKLSLPKDSLSQVWLKNWFWSRRFSYVVNIFSLFRKEITIVLRGLPGLHYCVFRMQYAVCRSREENSWKLVKFKQFDSTHRAHKCKSPEIYNLSFSYSMMFHTKFEKNWPRCFQDEVKNVKLLTLCKIDDRRGPIRWA